METRNIGKNQDDIKKGPSGDKGASGDKKLSTWGEEVVALIKASLDELHVKFDDQQEKVNNIT